MHLRPRGMLKCLLRAMRAAFLGTGRSFFLEARESLDIFKLPLPRNYTLFLIWALLL